MFGNLSYILEGHIFNWFWLPREKRRERRFNALHRVKFRQLRGMKSYVENLRPESSVAHKYNYDEEKYYTLWLQGEETAPAVVKGCIESMRRYFGDKLIVIDEKNMDDYIHLPEYVMESWKSGTMTNTLFSDFCRMDLLTRYGGYWLDATGFVTDPVPEEIVKSDFFIFKSKKRHYDVMFMQTCFIRAKKGDPLMQMWKDVLFEYWKREGKSINYFLPHVLLRFMMLHNPYAKKLYEEMPYIPLENIHQLWYVYGNEQFTDGKFEEIKKLSFFHKCNYKQQKKYNPVIEIIPDSFADYIINKSRK